MASDAKRILAQRIADRRRAVYYEANAFDVELAAHAGEAVSISQAAGWWRS